MTKVNVNVEIQIDDDKLQDNNLTIEDITQQLDMFDDEVIDGYTITRRTTDNLDNFYIKDAKIKDVYTKDEVLNRLDDMLSANLQLVSDEFKTADFYYSRLDLNMISTVTEITSIIFATKEFTGIKELTIDKKLLSNYDLTFDTLMKIENNLYNRL